MRVIIIGMCVYLIIASVCVCEFVCVLYGWVMYMYIYSEYVCVYSYMCMYVGVPVGVRTCGVLIWVHV